MKIKLSAIIGFLILLIPFSYFFSTIVENQILYNYKDVLFLVIAMISPFLFVKKVNIAYLLFALYFVLVNIYAFFISNNDLMFYLLSLREFLLYPLIYSFLGFYLINKDKKIFENFYFKFLFISFILTLMYLVFFPFDSFGATLRLKSFWDSEHEPALIAAIMFIWIYFSSRNKWIKLTIGALSVFILLLTASRSALFALMAVIILAELRRKNFIKGAVVIITSFMLVYSFQNISLAKRNINYNLEARSNQYILAYESLKDSHFIGIGSDKYGVAGKFRKEYLLNGRETTTMDSSILKYSVNYGIMFIIPFSIFISLLAFAYFKLFIEMPTIISIIAFSVIVGTVTGKLGAFPLNFFFYSSVGALLSQIKVKRQAK